MAQKRKTLLIVCKCKGSFRMFLEHLRTKRKALVVVAEMTLWTKVKIGAAGLLIADVCMVF